MLLKDCCWIVKLHSPGDYAETPTRAKSPLVQNISTAKVPVAIHSPFTAPGLLLVFGVGDTGQLGLGPDITERGRPARHGQAHLDSLNLSESQAETFFTQVCAGGMHTVGLTTGGRVVTCGCNDEGALGRKTSSESDSISDLSPPAAKRAHVDSNENVEPEEVDKIVEETRLGFVPLPRNVQITMVSAGDSHTAALDSNGQVWLWGTFRGPNGPIGLTEAGEISSTPRRLLVGSAGVPQNGPESRTTSTTNSTHLTAASRVVKIASGQDHLVCLTDEGRLYTMGCGEQGQLGRIAERFARTGGRSGMSSLLQPAECRVRGAVRFSDAWAGGFATFARCQSTGQIYACGLNNYGQLALLGPSRSARSNTSHVSNGASDLREEGEEDTVMEEEDVAEEDSSIDAARVITDRNAADKSEASLIARQGPLIQFMLTRARGFDPDRDWKQFAISMHHTLALDKTGHIYAVGRPDYGRLGLGSTVAAANLSISTPTRVQGLLANRVCVWIGVGESCSYAVDSSGTAYSWGMGSNRQLGHGDDDDAPEPGVIVGKQLQDRRVSMIDAGGQHAVLLAHSSKTLDTTTPVGDVTTTDNTLGPDSAPNNDSTDQNKGSRGNDSTIPDAGANFSPSDALPPCPPPPPPTTELVEVASKLDECANLVADLTSGPILVAPVGAGARRAWRVSPSSATTALLAGVDSAAPSTAGATVNSSVHSSAISDTSSVGSCASNASTSSQLNSAKSTDGGGSSRCSSFDTYSIQSSLPLMAAVEDASGPSSGCVGSGVGGSRMLDPLSASLLANTRQVGTLNRSGNSNLSLTNSARVRSAGMSICSTSSEPGIPTDTISLGSMTASPADLMSGEQSNG
ncbi:unnamed protein product [Echinostoma caproni]|uniref:Regulator of chromosome condensation n=1 Tax=Echinostoma caproni TaxID=27848 RepID=A0A183AHN9_9TREM|nr:unnamed protein product [Echinostoma caproni]